MMPQNLHMMLHQTNTVFQHITPQNPHTMLQSLHIILQSHLMTLQFPVTEHQLLLSTMHQAIIDLRGTRYYTISVLITKLFCL